MKNRVQNQLTAMYALAHDHSENSRLELAGMLSEVFLSESTQLSMREEELVNELIDQLLRAHSPSLRAQIAQKFSNPARMPRKMALNLASDAIEIASDVLKRNLSLLDKDLIEVTLSQSVEHAQAIAQREKIAAAVADALVKTGDIKVMQLVAENLGAELSPIALGVLAEAARYTTSLRKPIMNRPEMTEELATKLYWWLSQDLRRYALNRFGISAGQIDDALAKTIEEFLGYHQLEKNRDDVMIEVAEWMNEREAISITILPQVLRLGHFRLFNILLGHLTDTTISLMDTIVSETGGRGLAVVCRSLGIDKASFVSIFLLSRGARHDEQIVHPRELSHALVAFDRLTIALAKDMLHSWKVNPGYLSDYRENVAL
jgi:hypothetical protein